MALTRPNYNNLNTTIEVLLDPITVLNGNSKAANLDIGFIMNRDSGLTASNVALYWSETTQSFVHAFTSNSGITNTPITASSYAPVTVGGINTSGNILTIGATLLRLDQDIKYPYTFDIGTYGHYIGGEANTTVHTGVVRNHNNDTWTFFGNLATEPVGGALVNWGDATIIYDPLKAGQLTLANSTPSTSTTTGALQVAGGAGIQGNLFVGGNLTVAGTVTFQNTIVATTTETVTGVEVVAGNLVANSGVASTSTTTGALVVQGGVGISGNLNIGGSVSGINNAYLDRGVDLNDWNTVTTMGVYLVNRSSWSGTSNTPLNSMNFYGALDVINSGNVSITQNYRPYDSSSTSSKNVYWTRSKFNSTWTGWVEIINGAEALDGGSF